MRNWLFAVAGLRFFCPDNGPVSGDGRPLAHMVFFTLKDDTPANRASLISACHTYLTQHEGCQHFSVGEIAEELNREVNVLDFDIALHLVFRTKKDHDAYQAHPRHVKFVDEHKRLWSKVRVFDSYLS